MARGVWYEARRNRWRVRLYRRNRVIHRSYHPTYEAAIAAYEAAKRSQQWIQENDHQQPTQLEEQIIALSKGLI